jgi:outer membrane lipoprotein-sorting protein
MSGRIRTTAGALALWLAGVGGASADARLDARLRELGKANAAVRTLRAQFVQQRHVAIVRDVLRSAGTFLLDKRGRVAWIVTEPEPVRVVIRKDGVFADGKRVGGAPDSGETPAGFSPLPLLQGLNEVFAGISEQTTRDFSVRLLADDRLELKPRSPALASWLSAMEVTLDAKTSTPSRVRLEEPGGDSTEITFRDVTVNPALDDAAFAP